MKAAVFYGKEDLRVEEIPVPVPGPGEVLIRVRACGVCGTDMHIFDGAEGAAPTPAGTVLGHEFAGEIAALGDGVTGLRIGDRVCVDPNQLCNRCDYCREGVGHFCEHMIGIGTTVNGGFAEYCAVPVSQVYAFDNAMPFEKGAMTEPVACCLHGMDLCDVTAGSNVVVIGGGMIGLLMLQLAKARGAAKLVLSEPVAEKREMALRLGADAVVDPTREDLEAALKKLGITRVHTVIECVGRPATMEQAIAIAGKKSTVMLFGLTDPDAQMTLRPFELFKKELTIKASFINPYTQKRALTMIESGRVDVTSMLHRQIPVEQLPAVLADKQARTAGKFVVTFSE